MPTTAPAPDLLAHLSRHRSVRSFRPEPIPADTLRRVLGAGIRASSSGNMQAYSIVVTRDPTRADHEAFARNVLGYLEVQGFRAPR